MNLRRLWGVLAVIGGLLVATWSWRTAARAGLRESDAFTAHFRDLQRLEHALRLDVLRTRMGQIQSYDPLVLEIDELHRSLERLYPLPSFLSDEEREQLTADLRDYADLLQTECDLVERLKTEHSLLRNSLRYAPTLAAELADDAQTEPRADLVAEDVQHVLEELLLFNEHAAGGTSTRVQLALIELALAVEATSPAYRARIALFETHVRTILRTGPAVDHHIQEFFETPVDSQEERILGRYDAARTNATRRAQASDAVLSVLSAALIAMVAFAFYRLRHALSEVGSLNATLEARVARRTADLDARNGAMQRLLGQVAQGFATVDPQGVLSEERSAILDRWLGPIAESATLFDVIRPFSTEAAARLELGWPDLFEDVMPPEVVADMLRCIVVVGELSLELEIQLSDARPLPQVLVVVSDVTARLAQERAEREGRELAGALERVTRDPAGFREYLTESAKLVSRVLDETTSSGELLQDLHTLKGSSYLSGLVGIGQLAHELESAVLEEGPLDRGNRARLGNAWLATTSRFEPLVLNEANRLAVSHEDLAELTKMVEGGASRAELVATIRSFRDEKLTVRLDRLGQLIRADALRRGIPVDVRVEAPPIRVGDRWSTFFATLSHVARNAIAHGVEPDRVERGKAPAMRVCLAALIDGDDVVLDITDDGAGVDWDAVAQKAMELGLPAGERDELAAALFADSLSTTTTVDSQSGRGVGLSAVLRATRALGGEVSVESERGLGTHFRFRIPRAANETSGVRTSQGSERRGRSSTAGASR